ncbi:hypothetical protein KC342_g35 [Hortaea werneckii]|nr:hypothetical protein KC342_g35 [Hortaea werneckii]
MQLSRRCNAAYHLLQVHANDSLEQKAPHVNHAKRVVAMLSCKRRNYVSNTWSCCWKEMILIISPSLARIPIPRRSKTSCMQPSGETKASMEQPELDATRHWLS